LSELYAKVVEISGVNPYLCYQCGMCSAVCPVNEYMDVKPHQLVRYVQLKKLELEKLKSVWVCVACMTCVDRCPRNVKPGVLFEALREIVLRRGVDAVQYSDLREVDKVPTMALVALSRKMTG